MAGGGLLASLGLDLPPLEPGERWDPGLFGPDSTVWRIGRERILLAGGPAALLLQIAHPLVAAGVTNHSGFSEDPFLRLRATLDATLRITFGDREQARRAASGVGAVHAGVRGRLSEPAGPFGPGTPYDAADPQLALWVHATLMRSSLAVYERFVGGLTPSQRERYYQEARPFAALFGVTADVLPPDYRAFQAYLQGMVQGPALAVGKEARALAAQILRPPLPRPARAAGPFMRAVTAWLLPERLRGQFGLEPATRDRLVLALLTGGLRASLRALPARARFWPHYLVARRRMEDFGNE